MEARAPRGVSRLRRVWLIPLAMMVAAGTAGAAGSSLMPRVFQAEVTMLVAPPLDAPFLSLDSFEAGRRSTRIYVDVVTQQRVLQPVVDALDLNGSWRDLQRNVNAGVEGRSEHLLVVRVRAASPGEATAVAAQISRQLEQVVSPAAERRWQVESRAFLWAQLQVIAGRIERSEAWIDDQHATLVAGTTPGGIEGLRARVEDANSLVIEWQQEYSSLYRFLTEDGPPIDLEVLEQTPGTPRQVSPDVTLNVGAAAAVGLMLGGLMIAALGRNGQRSLRRSAVGGRQLSGARPHPERA
ncbi:MAG: hypothetical protein WEE66_10175 [Actinomycetota bacterium]